jgi:hypothetical protein
LDLDKGAYHVGGWDADDFFVSLSQRLNCFPPKFVDRPFTYLKSIFSYLTDYKAPHEEGRFDVTAGLRLRLEALIRVNEQSLSAQYYFLSGEYDRVVTLLQAQGRKK